MTMHAHPKKHGCPWEALKGWKFKWAHENGCPWNDGTPNNQLPCNFW